MEWLCWLFGALVVVTLLGHGIWVVLAKIFGGRKPPLVVRSVAPPVDVASITSFQLAELRRAGLLDPETHARVIDAMNAMRQKRMPPPIPVLPMATADERPTIATPPIAAEEIILPIPVPDWVETIPIAPLSPPIIHAPEEPVAPIRVAPPAPPKTPRRSFTEVFANFLRESNIRWGELMGGLLIVGCSIALVLSFWNQIASKPLFQFGIFTSVTAAAFALGLYAEHRWKLPTTSRGILLIATLLVPLNFLAIAALSHGRVASIAISLCEVGTLGLFAFLVWRAARVLAPYWPNILTAGVVGSSASLLITKRFGATKLLSVQMGLAIIPIAVYLACTGAMLLRAGRWKQIRAHAAEAIFLMLGILTFAVAMALGLVIFDAGRPWHAAHRLAPLLSLSLASPLAVGLLLWQRIKDSRLGRVRTAATAIAVAAALLMLGILALAWPDPASMLPLAVIDFLVLTAAAVIFEIPAAHALATPCIVLAYVLGFQLVRHHVGWITSPEALLKVILEPGQGVALAPLVLILTAVSVLLIRWGRQIASTIYAWSAVVIGAASILLVSQKGFAPAGNPHGQWIYLTYAVLCIGVSWWRRKPIAGWAGCALLFGAAAQFCIHLAIANPWPTAALAYATFSMIAAIPLRCDPSREASLARPARWTGAIASVAAVALLLAQLSFATSGAAGLRLSWVATLWFVLAITEDSFELFNFSQVALAAAMALGVVGRLAARAWFRNSAQPMLEPITVQALSDALAALVLGFSLLRVALPGRLRISRWMHAPWTFDQVLSVILLAALVALSLAGVAPAIASEFSFGSSAGDQWLTATYATGMGTWVLLPILLGIFALWTWQRTKANSLLLLIVTAACACPMWAAGWAGMTAGASALRWSLAGFLLLVSIPVWLRHRLPQSTPATNRQNLAGDVRLLLMALAALPILALSVYPSMLVLTGRTIAGPAGGSFFASIGNSVSYTIPLLVVAFVFVGNAVRERSAAWAAAASLVCNLTVTLGYLLSVTTSQQPLNSEHVIRLLQWNAIALAGFAGAWQAARYFDRRPAATDSRHPQLLTAQIGIALVINAVVISVCSFLPFVSPARNHAAIIAAGDPLGWIALLFAIAAAWAVAPTFDSLRPGRVAMTLLALGSLTAFSANHWSQTNWLSYHLLMAGALSSTGLTCAAGLWLARVRRGYAEPVGATTQPAPHSPENPSTRITLQYERHDAATGGPVDATVHVNGEALQPAVLRWTAILGGLVVLLALRAMIGDPQSPWWSVAAIATLSLLWTGLACWMSAPRLLYAGGLLLNLAVTTWQLNHLWAGVDGQDLLTANISVLSLTGLAAFILHLNFFKRHPVSDKAWPPFHRFAAMTSTVLVFLVSGQAVINAVGGQSVHSIGLNGAAALGSTMLIVAAMLWDAEPTMAIPQLYMLGLATIATVLSHAAHSIQWLEVGGTVSLSAYVLLTGMLLKSRERLRTAATRFGVPLPARPFSTARWMVAANLCLACAALGLAIACDFSVDRLPLRLLAATAAMLQIAGLLAPIRRDPRVSLYQIVYGLAAGSLVAWGGAWMSPGDRNPLDRLVMALMALTLVGTIYAVSSAWIERRDPLRGRAMRAVLGAVAAAWGIALLAIVALEISDRVNLGAVRMNPIAIGATIAAVLGVGVAALVMAMRPAFDLLRLPESRRGSYVYLSESLLAIAFLHLRLTVPALFGGRFAQYWPLLVMGLAFAGVGAGEYFRRQRTIVLSSPLFRTGVFLPLLPVMAFWVAPSRVDFSSLLFVVGVFYAMLSATRRSFAFGVVAAVAANGGLWSLLYRQPQLGFLVHPQLWLVPGAVSVLIAAQLNRDRLPPSQLRFIRYCCLMLVYVSSTAEIFLNGVVDHPWLPLVLAGLSVAGVMLGLILRIRPFLFLGSAFLAMAVITMIYYASANLHWTWLWYVAGIALGAAILVLFALFEKKRAEMLALVEGLKQWQ
jgi:hypothetical protein